MLKNAESVELDNRREISGLKDILSKLNATVATNTEATRGLKEVVEKEFNRQYEFHKAADQRVAIAEAKIDRLKENLAKLEEIPGRVDNLETLADQIENRMDIGKGWSEGVKWAAGIFLVLALPCIGYVLAAIMHKLFGLSTGG